MQIFQHHITLQQCEMMKKTLSREKSCRRYFYLGRTDNCTLVQKSVKFWEQIFHQVTRVFVRLLPIRVPRNPKIFSCYVGLAFFIIRGVQINDKKNSKNFLLNKSLAPVHNYLTNRGYYFIDI